MALPPPVLEPLLRWANNNSRGHDHIRPIDDYDESVADGLGFCAIIYAYFPDKISIKELRGETEQDRLRNFDLAFTLAKDLLGAVPYLDAEDMIEIRDKKSVMVWMAEVYKCIKEKELAPQFTASASWNASYEVREQERRMEELKARALARMRGDSPALKEKRTPGKIAGKWNPGGKKDDSDEEQSKPVASESAPARAQEVAPSAPVSQPKPAPTQAIPAPVVATPKAVETPAVASPTASAPSTAPSTTTSSSSSPAVPQTSGGIKFDVTGRSARGNIEVEAVLVCDVFLGGTAGSSCQFTVKLKLDDKPPAYSTSSDLTVHVEGPSQPKVTVSGSAGWAYVIGFTPAVEGQYWFDFVLKGSRWTEQPFLFPVEKARQVPEFPYQGLKRKAANPN